MALDLILFGLIMGAGAVAAASPDKKEDGGIIDPPEPDPNEGNEGQYWVSIHSDGAYGKDDFKFSTLEAAKAFYEKHKTSRVIDVTEFYNNGDMWSQIYADKTGAGEAWTLPQAGTENIRSIAYGEGMNTIEEMDMSAPEPPAPPVPEPPQPPIPPAPPEPPPQDM